MLVALCAAALAPRIACAQGKQQAGKVWRIGFLGPGYASANALRVEALRAGLRDFGYIEGKSIVIEWRWSEDKYERLAEQAAELVRLKVDLIVTYATPATLAAKRATKTIPIVMAASGDAVGNRLVADLAHPGENVTGSTFFGPELAAKRLELIKDVLPSARRVAVLMNPNNPASGGPVVSAMEQTAKTLGLALERVSVRNPGEFEAAFAEMSRKRVDAVVILEDPMVLGNARTVADLAIGKRLPAIAFGEFVDAGALICYGVDFREIYRRAAFFVDKIFKGAKPGDIPVERPTKFELVANLKTAKAIGVTIPKEVLFRADRVIE